MNQPECRCARSALAALTRDKGRESCLRTHTVYCTKFEKKDCIFSSLVVIPRRHETFPRVTEHRERRRFARTCCSAQPKVIRVRWVWSLGPVAELGVIRVKAMPRAVLSHLVAERNDVAQLWVPVQPAVAPFADLATVPKSACIQVDVNSLNA
jgi:hypothetical protein